MTKKEIETREKDYIYNLVWDDEPDSFRSDLVGESIFDMKCNSCLAFIGAYSKPEDCEHNYCHNCGQKLKKSVKCNDCKSQSHCTDCGCLRERGITEWWM